MIPVIVVLKDGEDQPVMCFVVQDGGVIAAAMGHAFHLLIIVLVNQDGKEEAVRSPVVLVEGTAVAMAFVTAESTILQFVSPVMRHTSAELVKDDV